MIAGELTTRIDGVEGTLRHGEEATVPPGRQARLVERERRGRARPGRGLAADPRFELAIATGFGLANTGRTDAKGRPNLLQAALMAQEFADVIRFTKPPVWVQRVLFGALAPIARRRGYKGLYPELLGPHGDVEADPRAMAAAGLGSMIES